MNSSDLSNEVSSTYLTSCLIGQHSKINDIAKELESLFLVNRDSGLFKVLNDNPNGRIIALIGNIERVNMFFHPIIHSRTAYIDCRPFMNSGGMIKNTYEYQLLAKRAQLDLTWAYNKELYVPTHSFVIEAFATWFSWGIQRSLNIDLRTANYYKVAAAIYYLGLLNTNYHLSDSEIKVFCVNTLKRSISLPASFIEEIVHGDLEAQILDLFKEGKQVNHVYRLNTLIDILSNLTSEEFAITKSHVYNALCRGAFIAANSAEITSVSLEHPSTFVAMMTCVTGKGLQANTNLGKTISGISRHHDVHAFTKFLTAQSVPG